MDLEKSLNTLKCCVVIPTYNNAKTLGRVVSGVLDLVGNDVRTIVVNDGSTDSTLEILAKYEVKIDLITYDQNRGKGYALRQAFKRALELGFERAVTIDSDGQHFSEDIPVIIEKSLEHPDAVIMGTRNMNQDGVPSKSSFGNKFSNFWFRVETFIKLDDTQTGFRLYPLKPISEIRLFTEKFELEIELIVRLAWSGIEFVQAPVQVLYEPNERVTHFRPVKDFVRISIMNIVLLLLCLVYFYPKKLFSFDTLRAIKDEAIKPDENNFNKAISIGFGCFMGVVPIWGFQLLVGVPLAVLFRMNKVLFLLSAHISIPPFIPLVVYMSLLTGQYTLGGTLELPDIWSTSLDTVQTNIKIYIIGAVVFATILGLATFVLSYGALCIFRPSRPNNN